MSLLSLPIEVPAKPSLESLAMRLPPPIARTAKRLVVYPRYRAQVKACRRGYAEFGDRYPQKVLFIAGLPKSGTTWLEKMVASNPGFHDLLIPSVTAYELARGGSHDYELPTDMFSRFDKMLVVTKMHVRGSPHNLTVLASAGVRYVALYRDLRDVAISHIFYVRRTPWHPEFPLYARCSLQEGLSLFAQRTLPSFADWIRSWHESDDSELRLIVRYEDMLDDAHAAMTQVARHFQLDDSAKAISAIVDAHTFHRLTGGRIQGQQDSKSFLRKGIAGDWKNYFTPELSQLYKRKLGSFLTEYGYEDDSDL